MAFIQEHQLTEAITKFLNSEHTAKLEEKDFVAAFSHFLFTFTQEHHDLARRHAQIKQLTPNPDDNLAPVNQAAGVDHTVER